MPNLLPPTPMPDFGLTPKLERTHGGVLDVRDALDELQSLRKKKNELIDKHIAKLKMLAAKSKIDTTNPLSIELFKETLPWALTL
jgi:hypothetical protein